MDDTGLLNLELDTAFSDIGDRFANFEGHRAGFRIRHQTREDPSTLPSFPTEAIRSGVEIAQSKSIHPPLIFSIKSSAPTIVGSGLPRLLLLFTFGKHQDANLFPGAMRKRRRPANHLIRALRIDSQPERQIDRFIKFRIGRRF